jgi:hypothetical protein
MSFVVFVERICYCSKTINFADSAILLRSSILNLKHTESTNLINIDQNFCGSIPICAPIAKPRVSNPFLGGSIVGNNQNTYFASSVLPGYMNRSNLKSFAYKIRFLAVYQFLSCSKRASRPL